MTAASPDLPLVVATTLDSAVAGMRMVDAGLAYGVVYVEDVLGQPGAVAVEVRYWLGSGHEHRLAELEALVADAIERDGGLLGVAAQRARGVA